MAIRAVLVDDLQARMPFPASTLIEVGDLVWWDNTAKLTKKASQRTDLGSAAANQADFTPLFVGVSEDQRLAAETSVTVVATAPRGPSDRTVRKEGVYDCDCASAVFEVGDLVGVARDAGNTVNFNQKLVGVATEDLAVGIVVQREPTAVTRVRCWLSAKRYGWYASDAGGVANAKFTTSAAASPLTAPAGALTGARVVTWQNTTNGAFALTTRTATQMFADIPNCQVGYSFILTVVSQGDNTVTVTAGAGVTITGTATVATKTTRTFVCTFTSATALTMQSVSKGTIE